MSIVEKQGVFPSEGRPSAPRPIVPSMSVRHALKAKGSGVRIVPDRRRHQRVRVPLNGRFMRADKKEYPCQIANISPGGMAILAPIAGEVGERIVVYIEQMGRFEGILVRSFHGGFAVRINATGYKREKIANQLTWLLNRSKLQLAEDRQHDRVVPEKMQSKMTLQDGRQRACRVLDVSLGGASVMVLPKPPVGEMVALGLVRGRIVRHHDNGVGIQFLEIQDPATIERQFG